MHHVFVLGAVRCRVSILISTNDLLISLAHFVQVKSLVPALKQLRIVVGVFALSQIFAIGVIIVLRGLIINVALDSCLLA